MTFLLGCRKQKAQLPTAFQIPGFRVKPKNFRIDIAYKIVIARRDSTTYHPLIHIQRATGFNVDQAPNTSFNMFCTGIFKYIDAGNHAWDCTFDIEFAATGSEIGSAIQA